MSLMSANSSGSSPFGWLILLARFSVRHTASLLNLVPVIALVAGFHPEHWALRAAWILLGSYCLFNLTSTFHETAHQTMPGLPKSLVILFGHIIATVLLVPYDVYRQSHIRHHAYLNRPDDWELWPYSDPNASIWFRRIFVWLDLFLGFLTAPYTYGRIYFHRNSPIRDPKLRRRIMIEYVVIVLFWGTILTMVAVKGAWTTFLLSWGIPHCLAGIMQNGRKMTEHLGMSSFDPLQGTRTVVGGNLFSRLCSWMNYDIFVHGPHHRFPLLTHDKLEGRIRQYVDGHPERAYPVYRSYFQAFCAMAPFLFSRPGVGLNAGASALSEVTNKDVAEFLEDEKQIVVGEWD